MSEIIGTLETDLQGNITMKNGSFEESSDNEINSIIKNAIHILQDVNQLQSIYNVGQMKKVKISNNSKSYEIAIGSSNIKIVNLNRE